MTRSAIPRRARAAASLLALATLPLAARAQQQGDFRWEKSLPAGSRVRLENLNGDVRVLPSTSGKVEIVGRVVERGDVKAHVEVHETSDGVIACVMWEDVDGSCDDDGYHIHSHDGWGDDRRQTMNLEVRVPADDRVSAGTVSGDVTVDGAQGDLRASSVSGDVRATHLHPSTLELRSVSGNVAAQVDEFAGSGRISVKSVSGDVTLDLPRALDADLTLGTVSGSLDSEYPLTLNGRMSRRRIEARIGKGGRDIEISTVSGDVRLRGAK